MTAPSELEQRAHEFARRRGLFARGLLGYGIHGSVYGIIIQDINPGNINFGD